MPSSESPIAALPPPGEINQRICVLSRELTLLRKLLRLSMAARDDADDSEQWEANAHA